MIEISSEKLKKGIERIIKAARNASGKEINIHIQSNDDQLIVYFNSETLSVEEKLQVIVKKAIQFTISLKELSSKVNALPKECNILLSEKRSVFYFSWTGGKSNLKLETHSNETPFLTVPKAKETITWPPGMIQHLVSNLSSFAADAAFTETNAALAYLTGLSFSKEDGQTLIRATNRNRFVSFYAKNLDWFNEEIILNQTTLRAAGEIMGKDREFTIGIVNDTQLLLSAGTSTVICKTMVGNFPNLQENYSQESACKIYLDRLAAIDLCDRVRLISPTNPIITIYEENNVLLAGVKGILKEVISGSFVGELPPFSINEKQLRDAAVLLQMRGKKEEICLFVDENAPFINAGYEDDFSIRIQLAKTKSQYVEGLKKNIS